jgi:hypothetical protein
LHPSPENRRFVLDDLTELLPEKKGLMLISISTYLIKYISS